MDSTRSDYKHLIWFIQPFKRKTNNELDANMNFIKSPILDKLMPFDKRVCLHEGNCDNYILEVICVLYSMKSINVCNFFDSIGRKKIRKICNWPGSGSHNIWKF